MPAAQVKGTRDTFCFFTMSDPNQWSRNQKSTARASNDPPNRDQEDQAYQSEDSEYDELQTGYTARKSREFPVDLTRLLLSFKFQLFLSKNGVILIYHDIPPHLLKIVDQMPTIACPVMRAGRGHTLSPTVTGGAWPDDITYDRMKKEKGVVEKFPQRFVQLLGISWDRTSPRTMECWSLHNPCQHLMHLTLQTNQFMDFSQEALIKERNLQMMMTHE